MSLRTLLTAAFLTSLLSGCSHDPRHQRDAADAEKFALSYGKTLRKRGEHLQGSGCWGTGGSHHYPCYVVFLPAGRTVCFNLTETSDGYRVTAMRSGRRFDLQDLSAACRN